MSIIGTGTTDGVSLEGSDIDSAGGNIDVQVLERGDPEEIRRHVIYKLKAAKGGGWIMQSDHSVSSDVSPESYELAIQTLRQHGSYPLAV